MLFEASFNKRATTHLCHHDSCQERNTVIHNCGTWHVTADYVQAFSCSLALYEPWSWLVTLLLSLQVGMPLNTSTEVLLEAGMKRASALPAAVMAAPIKVACKSKAAISPAIRCAAVTVATSSHIIVCPTANTEVDVKFTMVAAEGRILAPVELDVQLETVKEIPAVVVVNVSAVGCGIANLPIVILIGYRTDPSTLTNGLPSTATRVQVKVTRERVLIEFCEQDFHSPSLAQQSCQHSSCGCHNCCLFIVHVGTQPL